MIRIFMALLLGAAAIFAMPAHAQQRAAASKVVVETNGECPGEVVLRSFPGVTQPTVGIGTTLVKLPEAKLELSESSNNAVDETVGFNEQLTVYGFSADQKKMFVRTKSDGTNEPKCGWISTDFVLVPREKKFVGRYKLPQPLQMRDISKVQEAAGNFLNVKAVIHDLAVSGDREGIDNFLNPRTGVKADPIRLFDTFLVFDSMEAGGASGRSTRYWLIGGIVGKTLDASLKGWVRQDDVVIWPSRLAVQWAEDATVAGYRTPEQLNRQMSPMIIPSKINRADYEDRITRRLPVLEQSPAPEAIFDAVQSKPTFQERKNTALDLIQYYKIATPGKACRKDNPNDCLEAREIDVQRSKVAIIEQAARKIDVLILVDATQSMDPYLPITVRTIENFLKMAEGDDIRRAYDLRFGISLYGDYRTSEASVETIDYREIIPFFKPDPSQFSASKVLRVLVDNPKSVIFKDDKHKDKLEAPYAAVIRATRSAWRPLNEAPLRFVVHIADAGNRDKGLTSAETHARYPNPDGSRLLPQSTIRETVSEADVVKALLDAKAIYVPILTAEGSPAKPALLPWNIIFQKQSNAILASLGVDAPTKETEITYLSEGSKQLEGKILDAILRIMRAVDQAIAYRKCPPNSVSPECKALKEKEPTINSPEVVRLVQRTATASTGMSPQEIENIYSRDQSIVTMYSPSRSVDSKEMFTHWVALQRNEFDQLHTLTKKLCDAMGKQDGRNPAIVALREFAQTYANEDISDLTVREVLGKRMGIPSLERTDFSGRSREEIDDAHRAWQSNLEPTTWNNWHFRTCRAEMFTRLMSDGIKVDPEQITCDLPTATCRVPEAARRKFQWSVQVSQDAPTFYVPLDIMP